MAKARFTEEEMRMAVRVQAVMFADMHFTAFPLAMLSAAKAQPPEMRLIMAEALFDAIEEKLAEARTEVTTALSKSGMSLWPGGHSHMSDVDCVSGCPAFVPSA